MPALGDMLLVAAHVGGFVKHGATLIKAQCKCDREAHAVWKSPLH